MAAYREALTEADASPQGRAAEAMARTRLLWFEGNLAPFRHEAALGRALDACPSTEPWCAVALADWHLFMPAFTGADPAKVEPLLRDSPLGDAAAARRVMAGADPSFVASAAPGTLAAAVGARRRPPHPGTWAVGLGVGGAPGAGVGGLVRLHHPDVGWKGHRLDALATADSRGGAAATGTFTWAQGWQASGLLARTVGDLWVDGEATPYDVVTASLAGAWLPRGDGQRGRVGAVARMDDGAFVVGPVLGLTVGGSGITVETGFGAYTHLATTFDARAYPDLAGGKLAMRALARWTPTEGTPDFRLPSAGGLELLRGLPAGRFRDDTVIAGQLEWRHEVRAPLSAALFVDTAFVEGFHWTAGGGLRLAVPPTESFSTRVDVGVGPDGWGVIVGWGEAF